MTWTLKKTCDNVVKLHSIQTTLVYFLYLPCSWLVSGLTNYKQVFLKLNWNHSSAMFILSMTWCEPYLSKHVVSVFPKVSTANWFAIKLKSVQCHTLGKLRGRCFPSSIWLANESWRCLISCFCWTDVSAKCIGIYCICSDTQLPKLVFQNQESTGGK